MCLALVLEISCATFLADHYCYYWGVKETVTMRRVSQTVACKWQMFGFRMVYVVVYFPIDFIMMLVVIRYCKDIIFNHNLYQLVKRTIIVEDQNPDRQKKVFRESELPSIHRNTRERTQNAFQNNANVLAKIEELQGEQRYNDDGTPVIEAHGRFADFVEID